MVELAGRFGPSPADVALDLAQGGMSIRPHEWVQIDGQTPEVWQEGVRAKCKEHGIPFEFSQENEMTIVVNPERPPSEGYLQSNIRKMLKLRESRGK